MKIACWVDKPSRLVPSACSHLAHWLHTGIKSLFCALEKFFKYKTSMVSKFKIEWVGTFYTALLIYPCLALAKWITSQSAKLVHTQTVVLLILVNWFASDQMQMQIKCISAQISVCYSLPALASTWLIFHTEFTHLTQHTIKLVSRPQILDYCVRYTIQMALTMEEVAEYILHHMSCFGKRWQSACFVWYL